MLLFASTQESGKQRFSQFYAVPPTGGLPAKLPVPFDEMAGFSPDGKWFKEGHGVDPQLERAVVEVLKALESSPAVRARRPPYEKR